MCSNAFTWTAFLSQPFLVAGPLNLLRYKLQVVTAEDLEQTQCVAVFKLSLEAQQKPPWRTDNMFKNRIKMYAIFVHWNYVEVLEIKLEYGMLNSSSYTCGRRRSPPCCLWLNVHVAEGPVPLTGLLPTLRNNKHNCAICLWKCFLKMCSFFRLFHCCNDSK